MASSTLGATRATVAAVRPLPRPRRAFEAPMPVDAIAPETRRMLGPVLAEIFCASYGALDEDTICGEIVFRAGGVLSLLRDTDGRIIAFGTAKVTPVEAGGRTHRVLCGGLYARPGYRVGDIWAPTAARIALTERLRDPLRPLALVVETMTPASYRRTALTFPRVYPAPGVATPADMAQLIDATVTDRGLLRPTSEPCVVSYPDPASHNRPDGLVRSATLQSDPAARFFAERNPGYVDGHILIAVAPLGWTEIAGMFTRHVRRTVSRFFTRFTVTSRSAR